uniref:UPAR/Ly6 domain-containing protein n=1 Tax=Poecilia formosa TaxID=48698 RepID=A0A096MEG2_POEFO
MKNLLLCAVLMVMVVTADSLSCNSCKVGFRGNCLFYSKETCGSDKAKCYTGDLDITNMVSFHSRGCFYVDPCNVTETGSLLTAGYTMTRVCCDGDNCNGATSVQLTLTAALGAAATAVGSRLNF